MLVDLSDISDLQYQSLAEMENVSVKPFLNLGVMAWFCEEIKIKYPYVEENYCYHFYLIKQCGLSAERDRLNITKEEDLRLKLTKLEPDINSLCNKHQVQGYYLILIFYC
ncbi:hypothetical protein TNCT_639491 [Trichonephila clavata]|uniref:Uncharacterized protein n=1 Tax=Trichonephila clavata TaxID=2740835 RepID=A0A8X6I4D2_TRICU|nr:hypothetical protein TNCT_639491 [Trichonephila clavata]